MKRKRPEDPRGGHIRLYWALVDSPAWRALSWTDQGLYIALRRKLKGSNNGNIEATLSTLRHADITSPSTLAKSLRALQCLGFIAKTRQGGIAQGVKHCSLYRFTDEAVFEHPRLGIAAQPATNEWQAFESVGEARATVQAAHDAAKRKKPEKQKQVRAAY